jgi:hypothetical protein
MTMAELSADEARSLVRALVELSQMAVRALPSTSSSLAHRLQAHLGLGDDDAVPNTSMSLPLIERANVQLALDAYAATADRFEVVGLAADIGHHSGVSLAGLMVGSWYGPGEVPPQYIELEVGVGMTVPCLRAGIILTEHDGAPVAAMVSSREHFPPEMTIEVVATTRGAADGFLHRLRTLIDEHNSFRGKLISFSYGVHGEFGITFSSVPSVSREHVVLRDGDLDAIEAHAIGISDRATELRAAGQHVKRGLLLYGPPGTGKTHTISYLLGAMPGRTTIILSGAAVGAVGQASTIARQLQPATIVIEDVDLIGMDRGLPGAEHSPILFQLLNEMDGLADDADVLFILTTNRVDMLEPALAARPGRVDQAIETVLPDERARRRLIELYAGAMPAGAEGDALVERTEGVAPAFIKELARRATLTGLSDGRTPAECLGVALDEMLHQSAPVLRRTLGASGTS